YWFELFKSGEHVIFTKTGVRAEADEWAQFRILPGFHTPEWAWGAVMYQIFPDRFCSGDDSNDVLEHEYQYLGSHVKKAKSWDELPDPRLDVGCFHGGDLQGVLDKLDYLQDLGIEVLYFNPLFLSPSNHKYDTQDYDYIDPHIGRIVLDEGELLDPEDKQNRHATRYISRVTRKENLEASNKLFIRLVEEAHARGMRVIMDGVFNHCGSFNRWMDREYIYHGQPGYPPGAYITEDSPFCEYFEFSVRGHWPDNDAYNGWWDQKTLPKLNYEGSHRLEEEILRIGRKWVSPPYNADGWRLDVAADLGHSQRYNHKFWRRFREDVRKVNPDALILAEHYGNARSWLDGTQWDTVMNYDAFMEPVTWFLTGMEKHSDCFSEEKYGDAKLFERSIVDNMTAFPMLSLMTAMNELDNHDHSRFLTRTNHKVGRVSELGSEAASEGVDPTVLRLAVVIQMTWPGAPTIYYGDEAGLCGFTDPDSRRAYPWGHEDKDLLQFHREAIALRRNYPVLRTGSVLILYTDRHVLGYTRFNEREQVFVFINNRNEDYYMEVQVWRGGLPRDREDLVLQKVFDISGTCSGEEQIAVPYGILRMTVPAHSAVVLYHLIYEDLF
ncbi:MAG: glycoside hydrolase family 13 protein, partial [Eubacterium sp.]|nr:glycoside hydrolase family 13 protein [Eubacterium sp.]